MLKRIAILLAIGAIAVGTPFVLPHLSAQIGILPSAQSATSPAADLRLACPGGLYQTGGTSGTSLTKIVHSGAAKIYSVGAPAPIGNATKFAVVAKHDDTGSAVQDSNWFTAMQLQKAATPSLGGLAATSCLQASADSTLIGGDTTTGHETLLSLVNPGKVDSSVRVVAYAPAGRLGGQDLTDLAVSAGTAQVISLNGLIPDAPTFSIRVLADGPGVAAFLQSRTVRGTRASGVDWIQSQPQQAAKKLLVPGILIRGASTAAALKKSSTAYSDLGLVLRVNNAGTKPAKISAQIFGENNSTFGTVISGSVAAQSTADFAITGIQDGNYAALVNANRAVSASVELVRVHGTSAPVIDFAWLPAVPAVSSAAIATPNSGIPEVSFANPGSAAVTISLSGAGSTSKLSVAAGGQTTIRVPNGSTVRYSSSSPVSATLVIDLDSTIAAIPLINQGNLPVSTSVTVR